MKFTLILALLFSFSSFAYEVPPFTPNMVDETNSITAEDKEGINKAIDEAQSKGALVGVYILNRLGEESIEDVAEQVFKKWELGEKGKDNGVLIIVAIADRKMRIEVGYGLEGKIPDIQAANIIDNVMKPNFKNGDYSTGIYQTVLAIGTLASGEFPAYKEEQDPWISPAFIERAQWWIYLFIILPAMIGAIGYIFASITGAKGLEILKKKDEKPFWLCFGVQSGFGIGIKAFLTLNPGVFITLFPVVFEEDGMGIVMNIIGAIVVFFANVIIISAVADLFSEKRALKRVESPKNTGTTTFTVFGKTVTIRSGSSSSSGGYRSSSSSSSSSSRSSSSSGGRSGGGGSSGSW